jgi:FlaA1/EpsC-like NDP-sugar epimerase
MYNGIYDAETLAYQYDMVVRWLSKQLSGGSITEELVKQNIQHMCIYGVTGLGQLVYSALLQRIDVVCFADSRHYLYPDGMNGVPVYAPDAIPEIVELIVVTPESHFNSIYETLTNCGIETSRIVSLAMLVGSGRD